MTRHSPCSGHGNPTGQGTPQPFPWISVSRVSRQPYTTAGLVLNLENKIYVDRFPITRILNTQLWSNLSPKNMGLSLCSHLHFPSNIHSLPGEISTISVCMMVHKSSNLTWWEPKDCLFIPTGSTYEHCALTISSHTSSTLSQNAALTCLFFLTIYQ